MAGAGDPRSSSVFGARVRRKEDARLLSGHGRYVSDVELPRMLHVAFVRSVHAHARIRRVDAAAAAALSGVVSVVAGDDPEFARHRLRACSALPGYVETEQPILAWPTARYCGEAVAAVAAVDRYVAEDGAVLVGVDAEPLPAAVDALEARGSGATVHDGAPGNVLLSRRFEHGDVDGALSDSAVVIERAFRTNRQRAAPLEGRGGVAEWNAAEDKLTLRSGTQVPHLARHGLAEILGLPQNRIRIVAPDVGGAVGVKGVLYPEDVALCLLAMRLGRAVKWVEQRRAGAVRLRAERPAVVWRPRVGPVRLRPGRDAAVASLTLLRRVEYARRELRMRRPPLAVVFVGLLIIALGETAGAVMSQLRPQIVRYAQSRVAANAQAHGLAGSAEYDSEITARAVYSAEAGLSFFHTHAQGLGPLVIFASTVAATAVPWRRARGALYALFALGALFPLGYLAYALAALEWGRDAGIEAAESYILTPLGSAAIVGLVALGALMVMGARRGRAA